MLLNLLRQQHQQNTGYGVVGGARKDPALLTSPYQKALYELENSGLTRKEAIAAYSRANPKTKKVYVKRAKKSPEQRILMDTKKDRAQLIKQLVYGKKNLSLCSDTATKLKTKDIDVLKAKVANLERIIELNIL
jgi:hypothetical protein